MAHVLLEWPPSISKPDSPTNEATKNPAELYSTGFLYPIALTYSPRPSGKAHDFEETGYAA